MKYFYVHIYYEVYKFIEMYPTPTLKMIYPDIELSKLKNCEFSSSIES